MNQRRTVRPPARSTYGARSLPTRQHRRRRWPRLLGLIPRRVIVLALAALGVVLVLQQVFHVTTITVEAPSRTTEIQTEIRTLLQSQWRQQNLLTLDNARLQADLMRADPMIKSADVSYRWPRGLRVTVSLKQPSLGWMSGNQTYLLDRDGSAIGALPTSTVLPVVVDGSNLPVELGQHITTARFVGFTTDIATALASLKLAPTRYEVRDTTLDLYVTTNKGYQLILDTTRPAAEEASDLSTLLTFLGKQGKAPAEYIDLRIAGKAYYK